MPEAHDDPTKISSADEDSESESMDIKGGFGIISDTENTLRLTEELGSRVSGFRDELRASMVNIGEDTEILDRLQDLSEAISEKTPSQYRKEQASATFESQPSDSRPVTPVAMPQQNIKELENQLHILAHKKRGSTAGVTPPPTSSTPPPEAEKDSAGAAKIKELTDANAALVTELETLKKSAKEERQRSATRSTDTRRALTPRATKSHSGSLLAPNADQDTAIKTLEAKLKEQTAEIKTLQDDKAAATAVKKQIMTGLEAMRLENDELRNEREELDRQIIALKLDNEDAESQISELQLKQNRVEAEREEAKAGERRRIQTAAALLRKELSKESQKKEERYKEENRKLEEQLLSMQEQLLLAEDGDTAGGGNSQLYQQELQKRRSLQARLSELNGNTRIFCCTDTLPTNVTPDTSNSTVSIANTTYELDGVASQGDLFNSHCNTISSGILDGFSYCVLLLNTDSALASKFLQEFANTVVDKRKSQSEKGWVITATLSRDEGQGVSITEEGSIPGVVEKCVDASNTTTPTIYRLTVDGSNSQLGFDSHGEASIVTLPSDIANSILSLIPSKAAPPLIQSLLQQGVAVSVLVPNLPGDDQSVASQMEILQRVRDIEFGKPKKHVKRSR
eukprot:TRINITY_DN19456_c0_g1_i1.p1 TRINITY_DN19456_c0_g1~~TRINITY_DN19456_c0_g1_i1.p1  ORF type:complete len:641 (+),score=154.46 TRINITY_DN19456_c0_g1_i1:48-1925(+)